jgi:hypothetical protein
MGRYLVSSAHLGRHDDPWIIEAPSADVIAERYPVFADQPMYQMPDERPDWLDDHWLAFAQEHHSHRLGEPESRSLAALAEHHANGDVYRWYALERSENGERVPSGDLGSWRPLSEGDPVAKLPNHPGGWWRVVAVEPARDATVSGTLVIEQIES